MKSKDSKLGNVIFFIFGLIFFIAGVGAAYATFGKMTLSYFDSSNWQKVPANISSLKLKTSRGDSTTFRVEASYSYFFNGDRQSDAVALSDTSDNVGSYWQDLHTKLTRDKANGRVTAWVNPSNPDQALLDRTYRWSQVAFGAIFLILFGGFGFLAMWLSVKPVKPKDKVMQENKVNGISSKEKSGFWLLFLFGCPFFFIGVFTFILALPNIINKGEYEALFTLLFVFIGGGLMAYALINQRRYKVIGPSPLFLDPLPGVIGGQVGGKFDIAFRSKDTPIKIVLTCKKRVKSGKNTSTKLIWQESMQGYVKTASRGMQVSFLFDCPENLPSSESRSIFWEVRAEGELKVHAKTVKLERNWGIPVEKTEHVMSSIDIPEQFLQDLNTIKTQAAQADAADLFDFQHQGRLLEVKNISERPIGGVFGGILFGSIFAGAGVFTVSQDWWPGYIFMLVGAIAIYASIFLLGRGVDVKVDTALRILHMRRRWFGFVLYKREVMLFDPSQFSIKETSSTSSHKELTKYYKVEVENKGTKVLVAEGIKGKKVAQAVMDGIIEKAFPERF